MIYYRDYYDEMIDEILYEEYNHLDENILNKVREYVRKNVIFPYAVRHDITQTPAWFSAKNRRKKVTIPVAKHIIKRVLKKVGIGPSTQQPKQTKPEQKPVSKVVLPSRTANLKKYKEEKEKRQSMPKNPRYSIAATSVRTYGEEVNYIVDTLIDEGYANDVDSALNIFEAMSEEWLYSLLEKSEEQDRAYALFAGAPRGRFTLGDRLTADTILTPEEQAKKERRARRKAKQGTLGLNFDDRSRRRP